MVSAYSNRTILVTGANNGIGAAIARAFARQGARVGLHFLEAAAPLINSVQVGHTFAGRAGAEAVARQIGDLGAAVALGYHGQRCGARSGADRLHHARNGTATPADDSAASPRHAGGHRGRGRPPGVGGNGLDDGAGHPGGRWPRSLGRHDQRLQPTGDRFMIAHG